MIQKSIGVPYRFSEKPFMPLRRYTDLTSKRLLYLSKAAFVGSSNPTVGRFFHILVHSVKHYRVVKNPRMTNGAAATSGKISSGKIVVEHMVQSFRFLLRLHRHLFAADGEFASSRIIV